MRRVGSARAIRKEVPYSERVTRSLFLALGLLVAGCGSDATSSAPSAGDPSPSASTDASASAGDWRGYARVAVEEWPTKPLDDDRWVAVSADLGCIGRAHHGDPAAHRDAMTRALAHHATTAADVMDYGIAVNGGPKAGDLGGRVARRVQGCR